MKYSLKDTIYSPFRGSGGKKTGQFRGQGGKKNGKKGL